MESGLNTLFLVLKLKKGRFRLIHWSFIVDPDEREFAAHYLCNWKMMGLRRKTVMKKGTCQWRLNLDAPMHLEWGSLIFQHTKRTSEMQRSSYQDGKIGWSCFAGWKVFVLLNGWRIDEKEVFNLFACYLIYSWKGSD